VPRLKVIGFYCFVIVTPWWWQTSAETCRSFNNFYEFYFNNSNNKTNNCTNVKIIFFHTICHNSEMFRPIEIIFRELHIFGNQNI